MNKHQAELRRAIVVAVAAQRSCVVSSGDPFGRHLSRRPDEEFVKRLWQFATAIALAEPQDVEPPDPAKQLEQAFEVLTVQLHYDEQKREQIAACLLASMRAAGCEVMKEVNDRIETERLYQSALKQAASNGTQLSAALIALRKREVENSALLEKQVDTLNQLEDVKKTLRAYSSSELAAENAELRARVNQLLSDRRPEYGT